MATQIGTDPGTGEPIYAPLTSSQLAAIGSTPEGRAIPNFTYSQAAYQAANLGVTPTSLNKIISQAPIYPPSSPAPVVEVYKPGSTMYELGFRTSDEYTGAAARAGVGPHINEVAPVVTAPLTAFQKALAFQSVGLVGTLGRPAYNPITGETAGSPQVGRVPLTKGEVKVSSGEYISPVSAPSLESSGKVDTGLTVIGVDPSKNQVLVRDASGSTVWKDATSAQVLEASAALAGGEGYYNKPYDVPSGGSSALNLVGQLAESPVAKIMNQWNPLISGTKFTGSEEQYKAFSAQMESALQKPSVMYNWRGQRVEIPTGVVQGLSVLSPTKQFEALSQYGVIEKGSQFIPGKGSNWNFTPLSLLVTQQLGQRTAQVRGSALAELKDYKVGEGYDLARAISEGVSINALRDAGFKESVIQETQRSLGVMKEPQSVSEYISRWSQLHGKEDLNYLPKAASIWGADQSFATQDKVMGQYRKDLAAAREDYAKEFGQGTLTGSTLWGTPQRLGEAMPYLYFTPVGPLMMVSSVVGKVAQPGGYKPKNLWEVGFDVASLVVGTKGIAGQIGSFSPMLTAPKFGNILNISGTPSSINVGAPSRGGVAVSGPVEGIQLRTLSAPGKLAFKFEPGPLTSAFQGFGKSVTSAWEGLRGEPYSALVKNPQTGLYDITMKKPSMLESFLRGERGTLQVEVAPKVESGVLPGVQPIVSPYKPFEPGKPLFVPIPRFPSPFIFPTTIPGAFPITTPGVFPITVPRPYTFPVVPTPVIAPVPNPFVPAPVKEPEREPERKPIIAPKIPGYPSPFPVFPPTVTPAPEQPEREKPIIVPAFPPVRDPWEKGFPLPTSFTTPKPTYWSQPTPFTWPKPEFKPPIVPPEAPPITKEPPKEPWIWPTFAGRDLTGQPYGSRGGTRFGPVGLWLTKGMLVEAPHPYFKKMAGGLVGKKKQRYGSIEPKIRSTKVSGTTGLANIKRQLVPTYMGA